jgi:iron complex transport system permease protein
MLNEKIKYKKNNVNFKIKFIIPIMLIFLLIITIMATAIGTVYVPFFNVVKIIMHNIGLPVSGNIDQMQDIIIFMVRFPRVIVAIFVGMALAVSGAVMQGMFRNPMADPGIIGVSSGAGLGAVSAIALGLTAQSVYAMPVFASIGAFGAVFLIYLLSQKNGKIPVMTLILSGIAVGTFISAITSLVLSFISKDQIQMFVFWSFGSLNGKRWDDVRLIILPIIVCTFFLLMFSRDLNVMMLGEEDAQAVGLNPSKTRRMLLIFVSIATASAVCISGAIGFVGLIVPHIMRLIVGPDNRILLPASAIGGAIFLVACDLIARTVAMPTEIGVGIVTSLIGAPYFLFLLIRVKREGGTLW